MREKLKEMIEEFGEKAVAEEISEPVILSRAAQLAGKRGGRAKILRPCPWCGNQYASREMHTHKTVCVMRPARSLKQAIEKKAKQ